MKANRGRRGGAFVGGIGVLSYFAFLLSPQTGIQEGAKPVDAYGIQNGARSALVFWFIGWGVWWCVHRWRYTAQKRVASVEAASSVERMDRARQSKDGLLDPRDLDR
jgi:hypothetical protein